MSEVTIKYRNGTIEDYEDSYISNVDREFVYIRTPDVFVSVKISNIKEIKQKEVEKDD